MTKTTLIIIASVLALVCAVLPVCAAVNPHNSIIRILDADSNANGQAKVTINVYLKDDAGAAASGAGFSIHSDNPDAQVWTDGITDAEGFGYGLIWTSTPGIANVWAVSEGKTIYPNLLNNAGFEAGTIAPSSWTARSDPPAMSDYAFWDSSGFANSSRSALLITDVQSAYIWWEQEVAVSTGRAYGFSGVIYSSNVTSDAGYGAHLYFFCENSLGGILDSTATAKVAGDVGWQEVGVSSFVIPHGTHKAFLYAEIERSSGTARFDAFRFYRNPGVFFSQDLTAPNQITGLSAAAGDLNGHVKLSFIEPGNDGNRWFNHNGAFEARWTLVTDKNIITEDPSTYPAGTINVYSQSWLTADPGTSRNFTLTDLPFGKDIAFVVRARDAAGNWSAYSGVSTGTVRENAAPITNFEVTTQLDGQTLSINKPTVSGTGPAGAYVSITLDWNVLVTTFTCGWDGKWSHTFDEPLDEGEHVLRIYMYDSAGNYSPAREIMFRVNAYPDTSDVIAPYPNPYVPSRGTMKVQYLVNFTSGKDASLKIYDSRGVPVRTAFESMNLSPGKYLFEWDGKDDIGNGLNSGVYVIYFKMDGFSKITRCTLIK